MLRRLLPALFLGLLAATPLPAQVGSVKVQQDALSTGGYRAPAGIPLRFSVVTYNVQARPLLDETRTKFAAIGPLLEEFDIVAVQECFKDHHRLWRAAGHPLRVYDNVRLDWARLGASGLSTMARFPLQKALVEKFREPNDPRFRFRAKRDGLVSKGILLTRLDLGSGVTLDFYNTHLEAGSDERSDEMRRRQTQQLIHIVQTNSPPEHLVIVAGDFNMRPSRKSKPLPPVVPKDLGNLERSQLLAFIMRELGLANASSAGGRPAAALIDHILYRSGTRHQLSPVAWRHESDRFRQIDGTPWSDHDPVSAVFRITSKKPSTTRPKSES